MELFNSSHRSRQYGQSGVRTANASKSCLAESQTRAKASEEIKSLRTHSTAASIVVLVQITPISLHLSSRASSVGSVRHVSEAEARGCTTSLIKAALIKGGSSCKAN